MARAWFFRVLLNSSSFSAILRSISCLTCPSSKAALRTLFSSASREPSASSSPCCNLAVDFLPNLSKLQGGPQDLVLLRLKGALSLLQPLLQLLLLRFQPPPLLVQLVDGAAAIAKLVEKILDLVSQVLVLAPHDVQLLVGLVQRRLQAEPLGIEVPALRVASIQLSMEILGLGFPFTDDLVEVTSSLLGDAGSGVSPLVLHPDLLQFRLHAELLLLGRADLAVQVLDVLLGLGDLGRQLRLAALQLVNAAESLGFILGLPELDLSLGLGESLQNIVLLLRLLVSPHLEVLDLSQEVLVLGEQSGPVPGLPVCELLGVLELGAQGDLVLLQVGDGILSLLDLAREVLALSLAS